MGGDGCRDRGGQEGSWKVYISNPGLLVVIGVGGMERGGCRADVPSRCASPPKKKMLPKPE